jgi:hypothetical protein
MTANGSTPNPAIAPVGFVELGTFCLGLFVGTVASIGIGLITTFETFGKAVTVILSAALGGVTLAFIQVVREFRTGAAIGAYCAGLLVAILWAYAGIATKNILSPDTPHVVMGYLQMAATVLVTGFGGFLFLLPTLIQTWKGFRPKR